jgi:ABC-2 type transport system ATP-binding protein
MVTVKNLSKYYGKRQAVRDISFSIVPGEILGFLGPNGAGKSTTMNIITGYQAASSGSVTLDGLDISDYPEETRRKLGYLPEQPPLYPDMGVAEYMAFCAELKGVPRQRRKSAIDEALGMTGAGDVRTRRIGNLSKGFRQRVGLAQAILASPGVLILDEPTVGLDPAQIQDMRELIRTLGEGRTIILSSHILPEVSAVCSRILIMDKGRIVADGSADRLAAGMTDAGSLLLRVDGDIGTLEKILESSRMRAEGVTSFSVLPSGEVSIAVEKNRDPRQALFYMLAEARLPILGLRESIPSLEDLFLKITSGEDSV